MGRILITGFNARHASPRRATRDVCLAALLASAYTELGHDVEHRSVSVEESLEDYDKVFVGMASPLAVSSNRTYGALAALGRVWPTEKLVMFLDDPDVGKVSNGFDSLVRKPEQLTKPFFQARPDFDVASTDQWHTWMLAVAEAVSTREWPTVLVPVHTWADVDSLLVRLPQQMRANAVGVDLSTFITPPHLQDNGRGTFWVTEEKFDSAWVRGLQLTHPVKNLVRQRDTMRFQEYQRAWGVIDSQVSPVGPGWLAPRLVHAVRCGALYATRWQSMAEVGASFTMLPHAMEDMTPLQRDQVAVGQRDLLDAASWSREQALQAASDVFAGIPIQALEPA